jgi:hypothetical protein
MVYALYGNSTYDQFKAALADAKTSKEKLSELLIRCSQIGKQQWVEDLVTAGVNVNCKTKVGLRVCARPSPCARALAFVGACAECVHA